VIFFFGANIFHFVTKYLCFVFLLLFIFGYLFGCGYLEVKIYFRLQTPALYIYISLPNNVSKSTEN
jgi:hypothetical protein